MFLISLFQFLKIIKKYLKYHHNNQNYIKYFYIKFTHINIKNEHHHDVIIIKYPYINQHFINQYFLNHRFLIIKILDINYHTNLF